jgi:hypothetical protein
MAHSFASLYSNVQTLWMKFSPYFYRFMYKWSIPCLFVFGLVQKPYSPMLMAAAEMVGIDLREKNIYSGFN